MRYQDPDPDADRALEYLASFTDFEQLATQQPTRSTFDLSRMERLLARLSDPHRGIPAVHITGTKGKTSTTYLSEAFLRTHGLRTFRFVSPHLETVRERLSLDGEPVSGKVFARLVETLRPLIEASRAAAPEDVPSFFESMTVLGFLLAREAAVDVSILEVGLGGRLDATNVIDPAISLLLPIALDHTRILGDTIPAIAAEKAGIMKQGRPAATTVRRGSEAFSVFEARAAALSCPLSVIDEDFEVRNVQRFLRSDGGPGLRFDVELKGTIEQHLDELELNAGAPHQAENTALALLGARQILGRPLDKDAVRAALGSLQIPARAEWFPRVRTLLDGAHTKESIVALTEVVRFVSGSARYVVVTGMTRDRDPAAILSPLLEGALAVVAAPLDSPRGTPPADLARALKRAGQTIVARDTALSGWEEAKVLAGRDGIVVVAGSLYLAGALRGLLRLRDAP